MSAEEIRGLMEEAFPGAAIHVLDLAGDNNHYELQITAEAFRGKSRVVQHQMVYAAFKGRVGGTLHALALKTAAPA